MPLTDRKRPQIGDVVEITTPDGLAYAQYTHKHVSPPKYGELIRVLPGTWKLRPSNFAELVLQPSRFITFFPLGAACSRGIVRVVASESIPAFATQFPIFRNSHRDVRGRRVGNWFLWDGVKEWQVPTLSLAQLQEYPPSGVINDTLLIERITTGWKHELDCV
jgi:hypothetical protein